MGLLVALPERRKNKPRGWLLATVGAEIGNSLGIHMKARALQRSSRELLGYALHDRAFLRPARKVSDAFTSRRRGTINYVAHAVGWAQTLTFRQDGELPLRCDAHWSLLGTDLFERPFFNARKCAEGLFAKVLQPLAEHAGARTGRYV
jgi:hypothetical protein